MDNETFSREVEPLTDKLRELFKGSDSSALHALIEWANTVVESVKYDFEQDCHEPYTEPEAICTDAIVADLIDLAKEGIPYLIGELRFLQSRRQAPQVERKIEDGINKLVPICPEGMTYLGSHQPAMACTPWAVYGEKWAQRVRKVLAENYIFCQVYHERWEKEHPTGTGPGGQVRMGDNMLPGCWKVYVNHGDFSRAGEIFDGLVLNEC